MRRASVVLALVATALGICGIAAAQTPPPDDPSRKWEIVDNSFLVEEAFNQDPGVVQNIFTWTRGRDDIWSASFTQEWPLPGVKHQVSYTIPFIGTGKARGLSDVMLNYRYQLREETAGGPAIAPRVSLIVPTGRAADGLGTGTTGLQVNLAVSKQFGNLYVHANAGETWIPDVVNTPELAGSGIWRVRPMVNLMLEGVVFVGDQAAVILSPGIRGGWNFGDRQLIVGAAVPITRSDRRESAAIFTYISLELAFRHQP